MKIALMILMATTAAMAAGPWGMPANSDGECEYSGVIEVDGVTAVELYDRASAWAEALQGAIEMTETGTHAMEIRAHVPAPMALLAAEVRFAIAIETREGRYRYRFSGFTLDSVNGNIHRDLDPGGEKYRGKRNMVNRTALKIERILGGLRLAMDANAGDDW